MNRQDFLQNIQRNLSKTHLPDASPNRPAASPLASFSPADLVDGFIEQAIALRAEVFRADSAVAATAHLVSLFQQYNATDYLSWQAESLPVAGLIDNLTEAGFARRDGDIPHQAGTRRNTQASLGDVGLGITGATAGLADTGSLVMQSLPGQGRFSSLLPPVHIALLSIKTLFPTIAHFIAAQPDAVRQISNLVLISGPSRTADIEQVLTVGVHGPKHLHIVLVE